ncbi:EscE/YscE/SsaE family type III secretion system needle protein co-chaperone [Paludibacterium purpuratum]|uniref:Type III secretion system (T3SS) needle YscE family protein n=1 Tax=Paludibacterium purpuratum TaxID=1144873 RepID=A0A4R7B3I8_9NEIS|nr:EscE/YscE/SsaE family type III secretion system needle protein co-chaperone [Paludibacterium purpuratum]TDR76583.1 type III secretion system (T3SS) needle YscE family protein [Paludibacterium purpuratum]
MLTLTALEDQLAADLHGRWRTRCLALLRDLAEACGRRLREPLPAAEFAVLTRRRAACLAAMAVIEIVWARQHEFRC